MENPDLFSPLMFTHYYFKAALVTGSQLSGERVRYLLTAALVQAGCHPSMNTYRVVNVKPFRRVGLDKFAINEQLGGGLEDHRSI